MPIYEINCLHCGYDGEVLTLHSNQPIICPKCHKEHIEKLISPPSGLTGKAPISFPGLSDHGCCGPAPDETSCQGPGSCCGKRS